MQIAELMAQSGTLLQNRQSVQPVPLGIRATAEYKVSQDTESDTLGSDFAGLNTIERKINHTPSGGW